MVRADDERLRSLLQSYTESCPVDLVTADPAPAEMSESVKVALQYAQTHYQPMPRDVWLLAPADVPSLSKEVINGLLDQHTPAAPVIRIPTFESRNVHPALFPWLLADEVLGLGPEQSVRDLLARHPVCHHPLATTAEWDVDTPDQLRPGLDNTPPKTSRSLERVETKRPDDPRGTSDPPSPDG